MMLKTIPIKAKPKEGDYKINKRFAWWPKRVQNQLIWLESYKVVYEFKIRKRAVFCQGYGVIDHVICGDWDFVTEQLTKQP